VAALLLGLAELAATGADDDKLVFKPLVNGKSFSMGAFRL